MIVADNSMLDSYIFYWPPMSCYTHFLKLNNNYGSLYLFDYTSYFWCKATFQADLISFIPKLGNQFCYHDSCIVLGCIQYNHKHLQNDTMCQNSQMNILKDCLKLSFVFKKITYFDIRNKELYELSSSPNIIQVIKSRRMR